MGYIRHEAVIVVFWDFPEGEILPKYKLLFEAFDKEVKDSPFPESRGKNIVPPVALMNGYYYCGVMPDGSKEGWDDSDVNDSFRERLKLISRQSPSASFIHVIFGDEAGPDRIEECSSPKKEE